jgi:hypothetical protein
MASAGERAVPRGGTHGLYSTTQHEKIDTSIHIFIFSFRDPEEVVCGATNRKTARVWTKLDTAAEIGGLSWVTGSDTACKLSPLVDLCNHFRVTELKVSNIPVKISLTYNLVTVGIAALLMVRSTKLVVMTSDRPYGKCNTNTYQRVLPQSY